VPFVSPEEIVIGLTAVPANTSVNVSDPPLIEYLYCVIGDPPVPVPVGAVKAIIAPLLLGVAINAVGALGVVRGVTVMLLDAAPSPATFTASILMLLYKEPLIKPGIVIVFPDTPADT
jgi:hypothetical protein